MTLIDKIKAQWRLDEAKPDVYQRAEKPRTSSTSKVRGGIKKESGNFNIRVDTIGKANENAQKTEIDLEKFKKILGKISGLASFSRNFENPSKVGGDEINEFVVSELAKLILVGTMEDLKSDLGVVVKALSIYRPEKLKLVLNKIGFIIKEAAEFAKTTSLAKEAKKLAALSDDFNVIKKTPGRVAPFLYKLRLDSAFSHVIAQMSNIARYKKFF